MVGLQKEIEGEICQDILLYAHIRWCGITHVSRVKTQKYDRLRVMEGSQICGEFLGNARIYIVFFECYHNKIINAKHTTLSRAVH